MASSLDWPSLALSAYAAGIVIMALRLLSSLLELRDLNRSGFALTGAEWNKALEEWRLRLGIKRRVTLMCTKKVSVPTVVGWLKPRIFLPPALVLSKANEHREPIIVHELAHVGRSDFPWQLLYQLVRVVYWFHPAVWLMARPLERTREEACDDFCVHFLNGATTYRATLLEMARLLVKRPSMSLGIAMARPTGLHWRIDRIDSGVRASRSMASWPVRCLMAGLLLTAAATAGALELERRSSMTEESLPKLYLELQVVHRQTKRPLPGALVSNWAIGERLVTENEPTNAEGNSRVELPGGAGWRAFTVCVRKDGFVPRSMTWSQLTHHGVPARYVLEMEPGTTLGGTVWDEEGHPVTGAVVHLMAPGGSEGERADLFDFPAAMTDGEGRWRFDSAPSDLADFKIRWIHAGFLAEPWQERPADKLRTLSDVLVMKKGLSVKGNVLDPDGHPIEGAVVTEGASLIRLPTGITVGKTADVRSDSSGRFRFGCGRPGELQLTVEAPGNAPALKTIKVTEKSAPVEIRLEKGSTIRGRVGPGLKRASLSGSRLASLFRS